MIAQANIAYGRGDPEAWTEHWKLPDWETYFAVKAQDALRTDATFIDQDETDQESEKAPTKPAFFQEYGVQTFLGGAVLLILIAFWWTFTRTPALRNNILIGAATLAAFCLNPIAGGIVLAAWIFTRGTA